MPNQTHSAPRATSHHEAFEASRAPARIVSIWGSGVMTSLLIALLLGDAVVAGKELLTPGPPRRGLSCGLRLNDRQPGCGLRVDGSLGELVGVGAGVDGVEHRQL